MYRAAQRPGIYSLYNSQFGHVNSTARHLGWLIAPKSWIILLVLLILDTGLLPMSNAHWASTELLRKVITNFSKGRQFVLPVKSVPVNPSVQIDSWATIKPPTPAVLVSTFVWQRNRHEKPFYTPARWCSSASSILLSIRVMIWLKFYAWCRSCRNPPQLPWLGPTLVNNFSP